jgi:ribulose-phosphate 3-epimerase
MITKPERYIEAFRDAGADILTVHYEEAIHLHRIVKTIKDSGMKVGVALNPHTPVSVLEFLIKELDLVLIMSVNPGYGGQKFIEETYHKIACLKTLILSKNAATVIEIDGGIDNTNARELVACGADILVSGNYIFSSENKSERIEKINSLKIPR